MFRCVSFLIGANLHKSKFSEFVSKSEEYLTGLSLWHPFAFFIILIKCIFAFCTMSQNDAYRALKNSLFMFARMVIVLFIGLYTSRVVLRALGFEDYGIYNVVGSVVSFFTFLNVALSGSTSRYLSFELGSGDKDSLSRTYSMAINAHVLLAVFLVIILEAGGVWFINHKLNISPERLSAANWCFQFSVMSLAYYVITVPFNSSVIAHEHMNFYALVSIIEAVFKLGVAVLLVFADSDRLIAYSALMLLVTILVRTMYVVFCMKRFPDCRYVKCFDADLIKRFASFSGFSLITCSVDGVTMQSRNIFFNWFTGVVVNAAMGITNQVINVINGFVDAFSQSVKPQIIKSYASNDREYFMQLLFSSSKMNFFLIALVGIPLCVNIDFFLKIWLGEFPPMTGQFIRAIILFSVIDALQQPLWTAVSATGNIKVHELMMSGIKVLAIPLTYLLLKEGYSPAVTLYAWIGLNVICAIVRTIYSRYSFGLPLKSYIVGVILPVLCVCAITLPLPIIISRCVDNPWLCLLFTTVISTVLLLVSGYFIALDRKERVFILNSALMRKILTTFNL